MALDLMAAFTELPPPIDYVLPNMVAGTVGALAFAIALTGSATTSAFGGSTSQYAPG